LADPIELVGPNRALSIFGVRLVGVNAENGKKLLFSLLFIALTMALSRVLRGVLRLAFGGRREVRAAFWVRQAVELGAAVVLVLGLASIWFDDPGRLATALSLVTAGLAFALQRVITALAGYFVILRGKTFNVGDRITMGGVRGDVIALDLLQTTIMEMGEPPTAQAADRPTWVRARQYSGRIVTVTNAKVFDEPVYNYTRDFPYVWEELAVPITYAADRARAEQILLDAAGRHTVRISQIGEAALAELERRYVIEAAALAPRVYYRLTDNWLELTVRFLAMDHSIRELKDAMSRDILDAFENVGIHIASATVDVVGAPELRVRAEGVSSTNPSPR
jgi:small-conductance mechanosensitive channel